MPKISVIIPVFNGEKTIINTIQSVLEQSFNDFEIIIINDGSTDSTLDIISSIIEPRLKIYSYPNAGANHSRNRGLNKAVGEYVSFLDADDLWTSNKLEYQLQALQSHPEAAVAYSWTDRIDEFGQILPGGSKLTVNGNVYKQLLLVDFIGSGSNPLIRTEAIKKVGGFDESLINAQDWDMWLRLAALYPFIAIPFVQVLYRRSPNSKSTNLYGMESSSWKVLNKAFSDTSLSNLTLLNSLKFKQICFANRYKSLARQVLEQTYFSQPQALLATKCLFHAVINDKSLINHRVFWKALAKILIGATFPNKISSKFLIYNKHLSNFHALNLLQQTNFDNI